MSMSYADLLIGILIIVLLALAAYHALTPHAPGRRLWRSAHGDVIAIGERQRNAGVLQGSGTSTSDPRQLAVGSYRIDYQFDTLTRLALLGAGDDETLVITSGAGSTSVEIIVSGRYQFRVEPKDEKASWRIACYPIGTSSQPADGLPA
ncbi:MAG: hypothetical protein IT319_12355 [Anaerolineae bacterium]|nr:hypothetical protein [Anaerolineae bacterium]